MIGTPRSYIWSPALDFLPETEYHVFRNLPDSLHGNISTEFFHILPTSVYKITFVLEAI